MAAPMVPAVRKICVHALRQCHGRKIVSYGASWSVHRVISGASWSVQKVISRYYSSNSPSNVLTLHERGIFQSVFPLESTPELARRLSQPVTVYCGFDPTADSLHIGHLLAIIAMIHCQRGGHNPICVIGGATALIGDPSGRTKDRDPMAVADVENNITSISRSLQQIFENHEKYFWKEKKELPKLQVLNNADWYKEKNIISFLCTVGRKFRLGDMLSRHSVSLRLNSPEGMSFTEFCYQIFQSYDWLHLCQTKNCILQIGGNDQLGNIMSGYDLLSSETDKYIWGLTVPLVTTSSGEKIGKTAGNALWLNPDKSSPFEFYQHFINLKDDDVEKYLKLFTFLPDNEINDATKKHNADPEKRHGQKLLAEKVTRLVHGESGVKQAKQWTEVFFHGTTDNLSSLSVTDLQQLFKNAVTIEMILDPGMTVKDMCMKANLFYREVDADRVIKQGGVYINHSRMFLPDMVLLPLQHVLPNNITLLRHGKKRYFIIKWTS